MPNIQKAKIVEGVYTEKNPTLPDREVIEFAVSDIIGCDVDVYVIELLETREPLKTVNIDVTARISQLVIKIIQHPNNDSESIARFIINGDLNIDVVFIGNGRLYVNRLSARGDIILGSAIPTFRNMSINIPKRHNCDRFNFIGCQFGVNVGILSELQDFSSKYNIAKGNIYTDCVIEIDSNIPLSECNSIRGTYKNSTINVYEHSSDCGRRIFTMPIISSLSECENLTIETSAEDGLSLIFSTSSIHEAPLFSTVVTFSNMDSLIFGEDTVITNVAFENIDKITSKMSESFIAGDSFSILSAHTMVKNATFKNVGRVSKILFDSNCLELEPDKHTTNFHDCHSVLESDGVLRNRMFPMNVNEESHCNKLSEYYAYCSKWSKAVKPMGLLLSESETYDFFDDAEVYKTVMCE